MAAQASGLFDYYSQVNQPAWFDQDILLEPWFDKDLILPQTTRKEIVALQAVNRASAF